MDVQKLLAKIEALKQENLLLKAENQQLKTELMQKGPGFTIYARAQSAIQRKKQEKIEMYKQQIDKIVQENREITTKELLKRLDINNKTFYNLKLNEYFQNMFFDDGEGI